MLKDLFLTFIKQNSIFYFYLLICSFSYIVQVFASSFVYKKFFRKDITDNFDIVFKQVCFLWISLFILYIMKSKTESVIIPELVSYARKQVIINYLKTNERIFSEKNVERDAMKLIDFGFYFEKVFIWIIESIIPTVLLIIFMNIYFLIKAPPIGAISLVTNILNFIVIKSFFHKLMEVISERQKHQDMVSSSLNENLNNLIDIHTNNKLNDTINDTEKNLNNYKEKVKKQLELVMKFVNTLKVLNYSSNLLNIFVLYKTSTNVEQFFEIFSMFILYIPIFENMTQQIPIKLGNLNDLFILTNYFTQNKKLYIILNNMTMIKT